MKIHTSVLVGALLSGVLLTAFVACNGRQAKEQPRGTTEIPVDGERPASQGEAPDQPSVGLTEDYENTNRVIWQKPDMILNLLGDLTNKTVADIGAGTGYFTLRLVPKAKKVIAIDVDPRFTAYLDSVKVLELSEDLQSRLETRLAEPADPHLQANEVDAVLIVNTFMYIPDKLQYLRNLKTAISPGGKLLIVDFKKKRTPIGPPNQIRVPLHEVEEALYEAGYRNVQTNDTALDYQYILLAER